MKFAMIDVSGESRSSVSMSTKVEAISAVAKGKSRKAAVTAAYASAGMPAPKFATAVFARWYKQVGLAIARNDATVISLALAAGVAKPADEETAKACGMTFDEAVAEADAKLSEADDQGGDCEAAREASALDRIQDDVAEETKKVEARRDRKARK